MLNPLPGVETGWYEISSSHRLNAFTPYPAVGELANVSMVALVLFFLAVGLVFGYFEGRIRRLINDGWQVAAIALFGLLMLFTIFSMQYPLRQASRMIWYAIALDIGIRVLARMRQKRASTAIRRVSPARCSPPNSPTNNSKFCDSSAPIHTDETQLQ